MDLKVKLFKITVSRFWEILEVEKIISDEVNYFYTTQIGEFVIENNLQKYIKYESNYLIDTYENLYMVYLYVPEHLIQSYKEAVIYQKLTGP